MASKKIKAGKIKSILFIEVPTDIKLLFKAYCARNRITMTQRLIELMKQDIKSR